MAAQVFFLPFPTAFTSNGLPAAGAKLYFYEPDTLVPKDVYTSSDLSTEHPHPVVANGAGRFDSIYLDDTETYRLIIKDRRGNILDDLDDYVPGTIIGGVGGGIGDVTGLATVADRTLLAALPTSGVAVMLTEAGREGLFKWSGSNLSAKVTADTQQGIYVPPTGLTGSTGAWVRQFDGPINPLWFGIVQGDASGANGAGNDTKLLALFATLRTRAVNATSLHQGLEPVRFGTGFYEFASTINITDGTLILEGVDTGQPTGHGTILKFPAGVTGIRTQRYNTSGAGGAAGAAHLSGDGAIIRNLALYGGFTATEAEAHGIQLRSRAIIENVFIKQFEGDGIHGNATAGGATEGNANSVRIVGGRIQECRNGIFVDGADTNIWTISGTDTSSNREWGFKDSSFLGNTYVGCHAASNGLTAEAVAIAPTVVSDGTYRHGVIAGQEVGASTNAPPGTATDNTWWYYLEAGGIGALRPAWVSSTTYRAGGSYFADNANARNGFISCYHESGQGAPQLTSPSMFIGGMGTAGNVGTGATLYGGSAGYVYTRRGYRVQQTDSTSTAESTLGEGALKTTMLMFTDTVVAPNSYRLKFNGNDIQFDYQNSNSNRPFLISGFGTAQEFGTGAAVTYAFYPTKLMVGDTVTNARQISNGTAAPTADAHARGEIVWNRSATVGSPIGWMCTVAGTPGTWVAMANL